MLDCANASQKDNLEEDGETKENLAQGETNESAETSQEGGEEEAGVEEGRKKEGRGSETASEQEQAYG